MEWADRREKNVFYVQVLSKTPQQSCPKTQACQKKFKKSKQYKCNLTHAKKSQRYQSHQGLHLQF